MAHSLQDLVDQVRIMAIDATPIPAPPHAPHPGNHLFVNCHYTTTASSRPVAKLLDDARGDVNDILNRLDEQQLADNVSVIVTIYGHFPLAGASRPARRRIYRVAVLCPNLQSMERPITEERLEQGQAELSSELEDIAALLHQGAT